MFPDLQNNASRSTGSSSIRDGQAVQREAMSRESRVPTPSSLKSERDSTTQTESKKVTSTGKKSKKSCSDHATVGRLGKKNLGGRESHPSSSGMEYPLCERSTDGQSSSLEDDSSLNQTGASSSNWDPSQLGDRPVFGEEMNTRLEDDQFEAQFNESSDRLQDNISVTDDQPKDPHLMDFSEWQTAHIQSLSVLNTLLKEIEPLKRDYVLFQIVYSILRDEQDHIHCDLLNDVRQKISDASSRLKELNCQYKLNHTEFMDLFTIGQSRFKNEPTGSIYDWRIKDYVSRPLMDGFKAPRPNPLIPIAKVKIAEGSSPIARRIGNSLERMEQYRQANMDRLETLIEQTNKYIDVEVDSAERNLLGLIFELYGNFHQAVRFYAMSALDHYPLAFYNFGRMIENGYGPLSPNPKLAADWYKRAIECEIYEACYHLGMLYLEGRGVEKNAMIGFALIKKAANGEYAPAQLKLEQCYNEGIGVTQNSLTGFEWLRKAALKKYPEAIQRLSSLSKTCVDQ